MTRLEWIKQASKEDLAEMLCDIVDNSSESGCEGCVVTDKCRHGKCGFLDWLNAEARFSRTSKQMLVYDEKVKK